MQRTGPPRYLPEVGMVPRVSEFSPPLYVFEQARDRRPPLQGQNLSWSRRGWFFRGQLAASRLRPDKAEH